MTYTRDHGKIALQYLKERSAELTHFQRMRGALFFHENLHALLQQGRECHRCACGPHLPYFSIMLALRIYNGVESEPDDLFLWMCYVYVLYIRQHDMFDIGEKGHTHMRNQASKLGVRELDMLIFFRELADDLWELRMEKLVGSRPHMSLAS